MSDQLDRDLDNDSPLLGSAKNERTLMAYNFFSLTREHQTELLRYDDGKISIEVVGTKFGIANMWDKEVLIYLESLLQDQHQPRRGTQPDLPVHRQRPVPHHRDQGGRDRLRAPRGRPRPAQEHDHQDQPV